MKTTSFIGEQSTNVFCKLNLLPEHQRESCVNKLSNAQFFRFEEAKQLQEIQSEVVKTGEWFNRETKKIIFWDCEDIFEQGAKVALDSCQAALAVRGIRFQQIQDRDSANEHALEIDGLHVKLWSFSEFSHAASKWCLAGARSILLLNWILKEQGSDEFGLLDCTGNDSTVVLLNPAQLAILKEAGAVDEPRNSG